MITKQLHKERIERTKISIILMVKLKIKHQIRTATFKIKQNEINNNFFYKYHKLIKEEKVKNSKAHVVCFNTDDIKL